MNCGRFNDRRKWLIIVYDVSLIKSLRHQSRLILLYTPIRHSFDFKNLFIAYNTCPNRSWTYVPRLILRQCIKFSSHSCSPFRMFHCLCIARRFRFCQNTGIEFERVSCVIENLKAIVLFWFKAASFRTCDYFIWFTVIRMWLKRRGRFYHDRIRQGSILG